MPSKPETAAFCFDFETPVRFGGGKGSSGLEQAVMAASSDSIFAAVCVEWLHLYGEAALETLIDEVRDRRLLFSSLMPWCQPQSGKVDREYFLPRPLLSGQAEGGTKNSQIKKQLKQLPYIAVSGMADYLEFVRTGQGNPEAFRVSFGTEVSWDRVNTRTGSEPLPYQVTAWQFFRPQTEQEIRSRQQISGPKVATGLYWLVQAQDSAMMNKVQTVLQSLGSSGIGGKVSSGLGKFCLQKEALAASPSGRTLAAMLDNQQATAYLLISTAVPDRERDLAVLENPASRYLLVKRGGFATSPAFTDLTTGHALKRKSCIMLREGSCFPEPVRGQVLDLSYDGLHPVYRSGMACQVGLSI